MFSMLSNSGYANKRRRKIVGKLVLACVVLTLLSVGFLYVLLKKRVPIMLFGTEIAAVAALATMYFFDGHIALGVISLLVLGILFLGLLGRTKE